MKPSRNMLIAEPLIIQRDQFNIFYDVRGYQADYVNPGNLQYRARKITSLQNSKETFNDTYNERFWLKFNILFPNIVGNVFLGV